MSSGRFDMVKAGSLLFRAPHRHNEVLGFIQPLRPLAERDAAYAEGLARRFAAGISALSTARAQGIKDDAARYGKPRFGRPSSLPGVSVETIVTSAQETALLRFESRRQQLRYGGLLEHTQRLLQQHHAIQYRNEVELDEPGLLQLRMESGDEACAAHTSAMVKLVAEFALIYGDSPKEASRIIDDVIPDAREFVVRLSGTTFGRTKAIDRATSHDPAGRWVPRPDMFDLLQPHASANSTGRWHLRLAGRMLDLQDPDTGMKIREMPRSTEALLGTGCPARWHQAIADTVDAGFIAGKRTIWSGLGFDTSGGSLR